MPMLLPAIVAGAAAGGVAVLTGATATILGSVFLGAAIPAFAATVVTGLLTKATAKKPEAVVIAQGRNISIRQPIPPQQGVYGRVRTGGTPTFIKIADSDNKIYDTVITIAGHVSDAIEEVLADDYVLQLDANGYDTSRYNGNLARANLSLGGETGQPFPNLVASSGGAWSSAGHLQRGHTKLYVSLYFDPAVFPNSVPNLTAVVRGRKVYDPRTGTTVWSHNPALCLADFLCDTRFGLGCDYDTRINETALIAAANICDERVTLAGDTIGFTADAATDIVTPNAGGRIPGTGDGVRVSSTGTLPTGLSAATTYYVIARTRGFKLATSYANAMAGTAIDITGVGSGTHTLTYYDEPRYTLNGTFLSTEKPREIMGRILAAMSGRAVRIGGLWNIYAGAYVAPTVTLDEDDLAGSVRVQSLVSRRESANGVKGVYSEPTMLWQPNDFPPQEGAAYLAQDSNERIWRDIDLTGFVTRATQAQRLAKIELLKTRQGLTAQATFKLTAFRCMAGGTVALTLARFGWSSKAFSVEGSRFVVGGDGMLAIELSLRETAAAVFDWSTSDETAVDIAPNTNFPAPGAPTAPGAPAIVEEKYETTGSAGVKSRALATWNVPSGVTVVGYQLAYKLASAAEWITRPLVVDAEDQLDDLAPDVYDFRVRVLNVVGAFSAWSVTTTQQLYGLTDAPANVTGFSVIKSAGLGVAQWAFHPDLDVQINGVISIRHSPLTSGADWADGVIVEEFPGGLISGLVPLISGTYMAKARDSSGNWSVTESTFVVTEGMVSGFTTVGTSTQHTTFTGSKTNIALDSTLGGIKLDGTTLIDSMATSIDSWPFIDGLGGVSGTGSYAFDTYLDLLTVATRRFEADIKALSFDTGDTFDNRLENIDDWDAVDGDVINDCDVTLYARTTDDNPAGTPTWGAWTPFFVADFTCRAAQFKLDFVSGNAQHNIVVTELAVMAKIPT